MNGFVQMYICIKERNETDQVTFFYVIRKNGKKNICGVRKSSGN